MGAWAAPLLLLAALCAQAQGQLVIKEATRNVGSPGERGTAPRAAGPRRSRPSRPARPQIDISGHVVRSKLQLTVRNDGGSPAASVLLCDPQADRLAFLEVRLGVLVGSAIGDGQQGSWAGRRRRQPLATAASACLPARAASACLPGALLPAGAAT